METIIYEVDLTLVEELTSSLLENNNQILLKLNEMIIYQQEFLKVNETLKWLLGISIFSLSVLIVIFLGVYFSKYK